VQFIITIPKIPNKSWFSRHQGVHKRNINFNRRHDVKMSYKCSVVIKRIKPNDLIIYFLC